MCDHHCEMWICGVKWEVVSERVSGRFVSHSSALSSRPPLCLQCVRITPSIPRHRCAGDLHMLFSRDESTFSFQYEMTPRPIRCHDDE